MDDAELVAEAREGDLASLSVLWARHRPRVLATARRILGRDDAADEVAQETALVALSQLHRLREPQFVAAWLAGIARNLCRQRLRDARRPEWSWEAVQGGRLPDRWPDPDPSPEELAVRAEAAASVRHAIGGLPDAQRDAVELFYLRDHTYAEVARALGIDVNAVKARLHRARRALRPLVAEAVPTGVPQTRKEAAMGGHERVQMRIRDVRRRTTNGEEQHVVLLEGADGDELAIWVGSSEAIALALRLTGASTPRPLTYDAAVRLIDAAGGRIEEVAVTRLDEGTYFAEATVRSDRGTAQVDLRPSDAMNLALATGADIVATRTVLDQARAAVADSATHPDDFDAAFPDDADAIAAEIQREWQRHLERLTEDQPDA
jgi:RNA polymerase sigma factor (sigma-70 family)